MVATTPDGGGVVGGYGDLPGLNDDVHVGLDGSSSLYYTSDEEEEEEAPLSMAQQEQSDEECDQQQFDEQQCNQQQSDEQQCEDQQSDQQELSTIVYEEHVLFDLSETHVFAVDQHGVVFESQFSSSITTHLPGACTQESQNVNAKLKFVLESEEEGYKYDVYEGSDGYLEMEEGKRQREQDVLEEEEESDVEPSEEEEVLHYEGDTKVEEPFEVEEDNTLGSEEENIVNKKQKLPVRRGPTTRSHSNKSPHVKPDFNPSSDEEEKCLLKESDDDGFKPLSFVLPKQRNSRAKKRLLESVYEPMIFHVPSEHDWTRTPGPNIEPPEIKVERERKKEKRIKGKFEVPKPEDSSRMGIITCGNCGLQGHKYTNCLKQLKRELALRKNKHVTTTTPSQPRDAAGTGGAGRGADTGGAGRGAGRGGSGRGEAGRGGVDRGAGTGGVGRGAPRPFIAPRQSAASSRDAIPSHGTHTGLMAYFTASGAGRSGM
ncbi:hypothetical protein D1007_34298 [Hordeum vulgare]|nr:hypothetical protein D1007_34298 [Hordeum vulgare]